jgi:Putative rhamnosyl transferase
VRSFQHFILTHFNIRFPGRPVDKRGRLQLTPEWVRYRLDLMERFCLASLTAQTSPNFTWLVRYDENTPSDYMERLRRHEREFPNLVLIPSRRWFRMSIFKRLKRGTRWLLTTSLGSDDALHRDAVSAIQANAREAPDREFMHFRYGHCYSVLDGSFTHVEDTSTAFMTLVEPVGGALPATVICVDHRRAAEVAPVRQIGDGPMWLQVIHERNISSELHGVPCGAVDLHRAFGVTAPRPP